MPQDRSASFVRDRSSRCRVGYAASSVRPPTRPCPSPGSPTAGRIIRRPHAFDMLTIVPDITTSLPEGRTPRRHSSSVHLARGVQRRDWLSRITLSSALQSRGRPCRRDRRSASSAVLARTGLERIAAWPCILQHWSGSPTLSSQTAVKKCVLL